MPEGRAGAEQRDETDLSGSTYITCVRSMQLRSTSGRRFI